MIYIEQEGTRYEVRNSPSEITCDEFVVLRGLANKLEENFKEEELAKDEDEKDMLVISRFELMAEVVNVVSNCGMDVIMKLRPHQLVEIYEQLDYQMESEGYTYEFVFRSITVEEEAKIRQELKGLKFWDPRRNKLKKKLKKGLNTKFNLLKDLGYGTLEQWILWETKMEEIGRLEKSGEGERFEIIPSILGHLVHVDGEKDDSERAEVYGEIFRKLDVETLQQLSAFFLLLSVLLKETQDSSMYSKRQILSSLSQLQRKKSTSKIGGGL